MSSCGSIEKKAKATFSDATAWLPRDVLAGILLRLPTSDLRRYRLVCKEWREVITDPAFVDEHMDHGPRDLTHTIVFFGGSSPAYRAKFPDQIRDFGAKQPCNGVGYLLDEHWRVTARFTVSESEDMVGACNGLLCFLDVLRDAINIVEPFTGESITLPLPPKTEKWHQHGAYCFGFDPSSKRYKLLHVSRVSEQGLYVYTIGEDTNWRSVHVARAAPRNSCGYPKIADGAVYWPMIRWKDQLKKLVRFDLATEKVASELIVFGGTCDRTRVFFVLGALESRVCVMTMWEHEGLLPEESETFLSIGEGARWANSSTVSLPPGRHLRWPQGLQRGHLLLADYDNGGLYAHPIAGASDELGLGNLVLEMAVSWQDASKGGTNNTRATPICNKRGMFLPVPEDQGRRVLHKECNAMTYCYAPPLSPAPLARYFGKLRGLSCSR